MRLKSFLLFFIGILFLLIVCSGSSYAQGRDRSKFHTGYDTSTVRNDTNSALDTNIVKAPVDSTARIKYFQYDRKDRINTLFGNYPSAILLYGSAQVERKLTFDSLNNVVITETILGEEVKYPLKIPFEEYLKIQSDLAVKNQLYNFVAEKYKIDTQDELEQLFRNITEISIPLPFASETIFGPPTINLKINGVIDITASYQKTSSDEQSITQTTDQNNINFKQDVQVTTKGTVGDKLTIDADWNSQRTFDFENQLKLKYKGYPDEVVQSIEAGNVSLETKSNLIGSTQALFGVKAQFKLGPLTLTTIASQKKSEKKEVDITGGSVETPIDKSITDYAENNYLLDSNYAEDFHTYFTSGSSTIQITKVEVWVLAEVNNPNKRSAIGKTDLISKPDSGYGNQYLNEVTQVDGEILPGNFVKLNESEYTLNDKAGYVTLANFNGSSGKDAIAVAYTVRVNNGNPVQYGDYAAEVPNNKLVLKLLRFRYQQAPRQNPTHRKLWNLMLKNIYSLGVRNMKNDPTNLNFKIVKRPSSSTPLEVYTGDGNTSNYATNKSYLTITKLDLRKGQGTDTNVNTGGGPDNFFDFLPNKTIDLINGNIIFPDLQPFSTTMLQRGMSPDSVGANDSIYYQSKNTVTSQNSILYYLTGSAKGEASNRYSLGFNVVEGSVKVFNGAVELASGIDYTIDYSTGELLIRNAAALSTGAQLKITYESNDLFQLASKTLIGTRAELQINKTSYLGFTLINLKQQTLNDKVRIGEEPTNNTIIGFDASTDIKTNFLTKLVNKIPGYNTKEESMINLRGEIAVMLPDPNTKKSQIPSDNGESVAYVDDFEGSKKVIPLGLNPLSWTLGSMPVDYSIVPPNAQQNVYDSLMSNRRNKLLWYSLINDVPITEVYPQKTVASNQNQNLTPFVFDIRPRERGMYNFLNQTNFETFPDIQHNWSGVFKFLNSSQTNLLDENINYIEVWMKIGSADNFGDTTGIFNPGDSAKMIIDLGTISERVIGWSSVKTRTKDPTTNYHTEDYNLDGQLSLDEDNGLDGIPTGNPGDFAAGIISENYYNERDNLGLPSVDPFGDNFNWTSGTGDFTGFNGSEGNAKSLTEAKRIDTEDLNNSGALETQNAYLEYVIPIDKATIIRHPFIAGGGNNGWYQYIIPLSEFTTGDLSTLTNVQYARVWFKGIQVNTRIKIADFNLVGNQWVKLDKQDTSYTVGVVSIEENPGYYESPVGGNVLRQRDQSQTDQNVLSNEQSMDLEVRNLLPGQSKFVFKSFGTRSIDLINYKILKLFVNGDSSFSYVSATNYDASMVVRIGSDTANFYEYRAPIHPDKRPGQPWNSLNEVAITLADLTSIKQSKDSTKLITYKDVPNGPPGSKYGIKGNPSIRDVRQILLGVANESSNPVITSPLTGSVWFNEMRVLKTNDANGYAYTLGAKVKIADLASIDFVYSKTDPNFHNLEGRFGSLSNTNSWEISGTINAHKIINALLSKYVSLNFKNFFTIPISFSHREDYDKPTFIPNTDIDLESAVQRVKEKYADPNVADFYANQLITQTQTLRITNRFSVNGFKVNLPGESFFIQQLLNKLELSFTRNSYTERSPSLETKTAWDMSGNIGLTSALPLLDMFHLNIGKFLPFGEEFKNAKMYFFFPYMPLAPLFTSSISLGAGFTRSRGDEKLRASFENSPTTRNFNAARNFSMDWKFIEGWIVDVSGNYTYNAGSDLTYLETTSDSIRNQRSTSQILDDIFFGSKFINFGRDLNSAQNVSINPKINIPGLRDFVELNTTYRSAYGWRANEINPDFGNTVGYSADWQASAFIKLNSIFNLFKKKDKEGNKGGSNSLYQDDKKSVGDLLKVLGTFIPDQITLTYGETKQLNSQGVAGRPGFANFWMSFKNNEDYGPSRAYQLGWTEEPGKRVAGLILSDALSVNHSITLNTFITPIFPNNLKISFQYKLGSTNSRTLGYLSDAFGNVGTPTSSQVSRTETRPTFFISGADVSQSLGGNYNDPNTQGKEMSDAFDSKVATFPFPTWNLSLTGIEKFEMFSGFANTITLESGYTSEYSKQFAYDGLKPEYIVRQSLTTGFSPLVGVNINFKPIADGNLTAAFKLSKTNNYTLSIDNTNLTNTSTSDFSFNASYTKSGFSLPLFGLALKNDLTISISYTRTKNDPIVWTYNVTGGFWDQSPLNGSINTSFNPSIQYALSRSVAVQIFYKYTKVEPTSGSLQVSTRRSNEGGLNVKLTIQ